ncbi:hypothetical protein MUY27_20035 [Mucilaginibacter sp. RS28]|uniref:Uncharacterized protein n=1 Tax=Mucilaginibacter straminoryzae TaxID=2932774 RepID=A0A9X1X6J7_9SPHI|nr:hypothetical protein [Mucilaginibacter straminoryzae]MCJ8212017.1 hypothetical protein [Mucilaginibacter straminoryzae]
MSATSIIFFLFFALPLVAFLFWLMRQDKEKGKLGMFILAALVILAVVYTLVTYSKH